jgi:hypothetical protein
MGGSSYSASNTETDQSAQTSGNMSGNSADNISKQFNSFGSGTSALDFNSYLNNASTGFYKSIAGSQGSVADESRVFKYVAIVSGVLVAVFAVVAMRGRKS